MKFFNVALFSFFIIMGYANAVSAQHIDVNDYDFVIVPEIYDFQNERNQYRLNEMTKFYLDKNGFLAFYADEVGNSSRCNGLFVNVEKTSGFVGTKLQVVLKNCDGQEILRGKEGKSKFKEFEKAYQDALRNAFVDFPTSDMKNKPPTRKTDIAGLESTSENTRNLQEFPKYQSYSKGGKAYILRKTTETFSFYEEAANGDLGLMGQITPSFGKYTFIDAEGDQADAYLDEDRNLILNFKSGKIMVFIKQ